MTLLLIILNKEDNFFQESNFVKYEIVSGPNKVFLNGKLMFCLKSKITSVTIKLISFKKKLFLGLKQFSIENWLFTIKSQKEMIILNKGFFILYAVILIFSILFAVFVSYDYNNQKEQDLINNYVVFSNKVTEQIIVENNLEFFITKNIEIELHFNQNRELVKNKIDSLVKSYLEEDNFDTTNFSTELLLQIIPAGDFTIIYYQYVFVFELSNSLVYVKPGALYAGEIIA